MSKIDTQSLERVKADLISLNNTADIEQALEIISNASASLDTRESLQDVTLFERLLDIYATTCSVGKPSRHLLRSIGNLVSDNEVNRAALVGRVDCVQRLKKSLELYTPPEHDTELEDFAVKIFFNLCNESPTSQQGACEQDVDQAVIEFISKRTWKESDEMLLSIATALVVNILEQKQDIDASRELTSDFATKVLGLPSTPYLDTDAFLDTLSITSTYLRQENFMHLTVQSKQIEPVWSIVERIEAFVRRECGEDGEADEEDENQYRQYLNAFAQSLADLSSLSDFNDNYTIEDVFTQDLGKRCIPSDSPESQTSILPGCACLLLGNLAISDDISTALLPDIVSIDQLLQQLGKSSESIFLNAAAGLLRHLAVPLKNREAYFDSPQLLQQIAHLYTDVTLEQVQIAGLQLTRQILTAMPERTKRFIEQQNGTDHPNMITVLEVFAKTTSTPTKLEISRLITILLRTLQTPSSVGREDSLRTLIEVPDILSPVLFSIKQPLASGVMQAQAEAWLALNLFVRVPGGAVILADTISEDEAMFSLLQDRIVKKSVQGLVSQKEETETQAPVGDTRPEWVKEKEKDNAVLLIHDIVKAEGVREEVKGRLKAMLGNIEVRVVGADGA